MPWKPCTSSNNASVNMKLGPNAYRGISNLRLVDLVGNASNRRTYKGDGNPKAKLTWDDVREIREDVKRGKISSQAYAAEYGVSRRTIDHLIAGRTWIEPTNPVF